MSYWEVCCFKLLLEVGLNIPINDSSQLQALNLAALHSNIKSLQINWVLRVRGEIARSTKAILQNQNPALEQQVSCAYRNYMNFGLVTAQGRNPSKQAYL